MSQRLLVVMSGLLASKGLLVTSFMFHTFPSLFFRFILVLMESLTGSGHRFATTRARLADKLDLYRFDPWGKKFH